MTYAATVEELLKQMTAATMRRMPMVATCVAISHSVPGPKPALSVASAHPSKPTDTAKDPASTPDTSRAACTQSHTEEGERDVKGEREREREGGREAERGREKE